MARSLVVIPSVPMVIEGDRFFLDIKAVDGLRHYASAWPGPVLCLMRLGSRANIAYGKTYAQDELPFIVEPLVGKFNSVRQKLDDAAAILASGDNHLDLEIGEVTDTPVVFVIENTLKTQIRIMMIENGVSLRTLKSAVWTVFNERNRRKAFKKAAGLQANGAPAFAAYGRFTRSSLLYFDNRIGEAQQVTKEEIEKKAQHVNTGKPLRLVFSGRLERLKGADHLVPVIISLANRGVNFTFDIYGDGSLAHEMKAEIQSAGLLNRVIFHGPVPFDDVLVPALTESADLFVCCHRQSDPSCTYIETLACGVPIVGYENAAFAGILELGNVGMSVPMDRPDLLSNAIAELDIDRSMLALKMYATREVAELHSFEKTFSSRVKHLLKTKSTIN